MIRIASSMMVGGFGTALALCMGCNAPVRNDPHEAAPRAALVVPAAVTSANAAPVTAPGVVPAGATTPAPTRAAKQVARAQASALTVKRFVVTTGIKDREPLTDSSPLVADGSTIFAFAELANPTGGSENVRITFERKGGVERVGNVTLPIPGAVPRHRTWATTRFIRAAGVWDAVLWNEAGAEIGRTSFEVGDAAS
jgi:hypothetical protein